MDSVDGGVLNNTGNTSFKYVFHPCCTQNNDTPVDCFNGYLTGARLRVESFPLCDDDDDCDDDNTVTICTYSKARNNNSEQLSNDRQRLRLTFEQQTHFLP